MTPTSSIQPGVGQYSTSMSVGISTRWVLVPPSNYEYYAPYAHSSRYIFASPTKIDFERITSGDRELQLTKPIIATAKFSEGRCVLENKELDIISMSTDYYECVADFNDEVFFVWNEYGKADDGKLTKDAKELKSRILLYVRREVPHPHDRHESKKGH